MGSMTDDGFILSYETHRFLEDGRFIGLGLLLLGQAHIVMTAPGADSSQGYAEAWQYETVGAAVAAFERWDPMSECEPEGWVRHIPSYRRRPGGDPAREHVRR